MNLKKILVLAPFWHLYILIRAIREREFHNENRKIVKTGWKITVPLTKTGDTIFDTLNPMVSGYVAIFPIETKSIEA